MNNVLVGGDGWVYYETVGRRAGRPAGPCRHERRAHRDDEHAQHADRGARAGVPAAGACATGCGRERRRRRGSRGGEGIERDLEVLEDATVSLITERRVSRRGGRRR